jgi:hypothetical protein
VRLEGLDKLKKSNDIISNQYIVINSNPVSSCAMLGGSLATTAWHVLGLRMVGEPPAMDGSCEYTE